MYEPWADTLLSRLHFDMWEEASASSGTRSWSLLLQPRPVWTTKSTSWSMTNASMPQTLSPRSHPTPSTPHLTRPLLLTHSLRFSLSGPSQCKSMRLVSSCVFGDRAIHPLELHLPCLQRVCQGARREHSSASPRAPIITICVDLLLRQLGPCMPSRIAEGPLLILYLCSRCVF